MTFGRERATFPAMKDASPFRTAVRIALVVAAVALALRIFSGVLPGGARIGKMPGSPAPAWELKGLDGAVVRSDDFAGKVVVLDFWATWCPPCRKEIPGFIALQKQYGDRGLAVIGVSLDEGGPDAVRGFVAKAGVNYAIVMGNEKIVRDFGGIEGIPTTFIIDREGRVVGKHVGYADKAAFEKAILPLL
jgi:thiol-disulfide isomerase/thioredoxin